MKRKRYFWTLTDGDAQVLDQGERSAHNAALAAGTSAVRAIARDEGQMYSSVNSERGLSETTVRWSGDLTGRALVVAVRAA